ncbi:ATP-binding protein [candidate division KSB1 bacterium]|nr:ATP-binding protein [candidate division KSB1 bacterium]
MNEFIRIEPYRKDGVKFIPAPQSESVLPTELMALFEKHENDGWRFFAIDLVNVSHLSDDLLVLILAVTARVRRKGGEVYIHNIHYDLLEDLFTFNPKKYLTVVESSSQVRPPARLSNRVAVTPQQQSSWVEPILQPEKIDTMEIPYDENDIYKACDFVTSHAEAMGFAENELSRIKIAVYEACLNAIQHTRKMNLSDKVIIEVESKARTLIINVYDRGAGFNPDKANNYDVTDAASHRKTGGMGLHIIRRAMDQVDYQMDSLKGNKLIMVKHLKD